MSDEVFEQNKKSLAVKKLEKPKKLKDECRRYWTEIMCHQYRFRRGTNFVKFCNIKFIMCISVAMGMHESSYFAKLPFTFLPLQLVKEDAVHIMIVLHNYSCEALTGCIAELELCIAL